MVVTTGPAMSEEAGGALNRTIIFAGWKNRHRVKIYRKPRNPQSTDQQSNRSFMAEAVAAWQTLTPEEKSQWEAMII